MIGWIKNLLRKNNGHSELVNEDAYRPDQRHIYHYWNGSEMIKADPLCLFRAVMDVETELEIDIRVSRSPSKDARKAHEAVLSKIRQVFSVKSLENGGLTEVETIGLLDHFMGYCGWVKKNSRVSQTESAETSPDSRQFIAEAPPTLNGSASSSIASEPSISDPTRSPSEPASPSA